jgi:hypothetical protein
MKKYRRRYKVAYGYNEEDNLLPPPMFKDIASKDNKQVYTGSYKDFSVFETLTDE